MIASGFVLFLFGTAVYAGPFMPLAPTEIVISKNRHASDNVVELIETHPSRKESPFISNFIQKGTNVFFKPQFMMAAQQMPAQVQELITAIEKDDCKTSYPLGPVPVLPIVEEPLRVIERELVSPGIREVIEINPTPIAHPVVLPKAPVLIEEPCDVPILPSFIPQVEIPAPRPHVVIPSAPALPPLELPKFPVVMKEIEPVPMIPAAPVLPTLELPAPVIYEEVIKPSVIPPAPVLPPLEIPKRPVLVEEVNVLPCPPGEELVFPSAPVLPPFITEVVAPKPNHVIVEERIIPPAPVLPPFTMPKLPKIVEKVLPPVPTVEVIEDRFETMIIPEAPVMKPIVLPPVPLPTLEYPKAPLVIAEPCEPSPLAPLPIPTPFMFEKPEVLKPMVLPTPVLPPRPHEVVVAPCPEDQVIIEQRPMLPAPFSYSELSLTKPVIMPAPPMAPGYVVRNDGPVTVEKHSLLPFPQGYAGDFIVEGMDKAFRPIVAKNPVPIRYAPLGYPVI